MVQQFTGQNLFEENHACVLIPTYNNASTLTAVIQDVSTYTRSILVINDGSTDDTATVLQQFPHIKVLSYAPNKGKGWALRQGILLANSMGYRYAISIDSDGQHYAKDLPAFLRCIQTNPEALIVGARNMEQDGIPAKSSFGNRFSNFWYKLETGFALPDTQSGYRLYPVNKLAKMHFFTRKYEFEIEVIVRAAWKGIPVLSIPVSVYYPDPALRISHFRPFRDFSRISVLNSILVIICFLYIKPRNFFRALFSPRKFIKVFKEQLLESQQSDLVKSVSVGFGIFMGIIPIWGFQLILAIFLAILLKLNKAIVILSANISIPPMIPLIIFASYKAGSWWMHGKGIDLAYSRNISRKSISENFQQYLYGSFTLALLAGLTALIAAYLLLKIFNRKSLQAG